MIKLNSYQDGNKPGKYQKNKFLKLNKEMRKSSFTLIELIIVLGILAVLASLVYPSYYSSLRSYLLNNVRISLQQNARIGMKNMLTELEGGMSIDMEKDNPDWNPSGSWDHYHETHPYFMIFYRPNSNNPIQKGNTIAFYAALSDNPTSPIDPAATSGMSNLYLREYDVANSSWNDPIPLLRPEVKVTQLNFILGGEKQNKILITLELARKGPKPISWRTYKLISAVKLGGK